MKCLHCGAEWNAPNAKPITSCPFCGYSLEQPKDTHAKVCLPHRATLSDFDVVGSVIRKYNGNETDIVVPPGITETGMINLGTGAFYKNSSIRSVIFSKGFLKLGERAFYGCENLERVVLPEGVTSIGKSAFEGCKNLSTVVLPSTLASIEASAFANCSKLSDIELPASLISIQSDAFSKCESIRAITMPPTLNTVGKDVFSDCSNLISATLPTHLTISYTSTGEGMFCRCKSLASIYIPGSLQVIPDGMFAGCTSLSSVKIGSGITKIGDGAFGGCTALTTLHLPNTVTDIYSGAFAHCTYLQGIDIPDSVTSILCGFGSSYFPPFRGCTALYNVTYPHRFKAEIFRDSAFYDKALEIEKQPNSGCYIATCVYGSYDCPSVWVLRRFRDEVLKHSLLGRAFICLYYKISPTIVRFAKNNTLLKNVMRNWLDAFVSKLKRKGFQDTPYKDIS